MPTITVHRRDLEGLTGRRIPPDELERLLPLVKGELKESGADGDELRIELNDSNRPDLWCVEGIARQIRLCAPVNRKGVRRAAAQKRRKAKPVQILVEPPVMAIRPFLGAVIARGVDIDATLLQHLIQTQEKLADIFGQKRRTLSIGYYRLAPLRFPLTYTAVKPQGGVFVPLGMDRPLTLEAMLDEHPKGREYGHLVRNAPLYPYFVDAGGQALSFPPITNSREIGEVRVGDRDLLVEVTGTDLRLVMLLINLLAANLADRGAAIEPVELVYPKATIYGRRIVMPYDFAAPLLLRRRELDAVLGESLKEGEVTALLRRAGHRVVAKSGGWQVTPPPYRGDIMHPVDLIEDVAIVRGYASLPPEMPRSFTVGSAAPQTRLEERARAAMVGLGFQEVLSNVLCAAGDVLEKMGIDEPVIEIENALSLQHAVLRQWLLPSLLRIEAASGHAFYPHRIFEVGEVTRMAGGSDGTARALTCSHAAALWAAPAVAFSELHSVLELFMLEAGGSYRLRAADHPSFLGGRVGEILVGGEPVGWIGELHPAVLERWKIAMPCAGWELELTPSRPAGSGSPP